MKRLFYLLLLTILTGTFHLKAQSIERIQGNFSELVKQKSLAFRFTYEDLQVGKYKKESEYIDKRVSEINKKEPGKGDAWAAHWKSERTDSFEPAFKRAFIAASGKSEDEHAEFTVIFHTTFLEPGFSTAAILVHKNPEVRGELLLVRTSEPDKILGKAEISKALGKAGPHFETGEHMEEAYDVAGDALGQFILNN